MKLIVGLGNPGKQYENTRHNVGFMVLDAFVEKHSTTQTPQGDPLFVSWQERREVYTLTCSPNQVAAVLAKPQLFMNSSGEAVLKLVKLYKINPKNLLVVHDDLDLKLGEFKLQLAKGPKVHNGVNSIEQSLQTGYFWRLRVGVDNREPANRTPGEEYVLQPFRPEEQVIIDKLIKDTLLREFSQWF